MPRVVKISNVSNKSVPVITARLCDNFWSKFRGLMLSPPLSETSGVLLDEGIEGKMNTSIHMFFMKFDICAIWIDNNFRIVDVKIAHRWNPAYVPSEPARYILETHVFQKSNFQIGDQVSFLYE